MICSPEIPEMVSIAGGTFLMGCERGQENETPVHRVWVDGYAIAKFPVTNHQYKVYIEDAAVAPPPFWTEPMFAHPEMPVVGISWGEAMAYCRWLSDREGKYLRLPTEAEWERAARGGREGALYPWGDELPSQRPYSGIDGSTGGPPRCDAGEPNGFGLLLMSEGVHEWCSDYFAADYYRKSPARNPHGPPTGHRRASRGGSWRHRVKFCRCAARSSLPPGFKYADYGFRVAMTVAT
jgi:formylglycine-generating enzyme required for sulfatase activity